MAATPDFLPEIFSNRLIFNAGRFQHLGYMGFGEQDLGAHLQATVAFGSGGA